MGKAWHAGHNLVYEAAARRTLDPLHVSFPRFYLRANLRKTMDHNWPPDNILKIVTFRGQSVP